MTFWLTYQMSVTGKLDWQLDWLESQPGNSKIHSGCVWGAQEGMTLVTVSGPSSFLLRHSPPGLGSDHCEWNSFVIWCPSITMFLPVSQLIMDWIPNCKSIESLITLVVCAYSVQQWKWWIFHYSQNDTILYYSIVARNLDVRALTCVTTWLIYLT